MNSTIDSQTLLVIPGFLTEPHKLAKAHDSSALNAIDPTAYLDRRAWQQSINSICDERVTVECFDWGSQSVVHLFSHLIQRLISDGDGPILNVRAITSKLSKIALELHSSWRSARDEADRSVELLCQRIISDPAPENLTIVSHSLGARIALKALDQLSRSHVQKLPKISAWAPALSASEMSCEEISQLPDLPEIVYSDTDLVLKYIFPLGQGPKPSASILGGLSLIATLATHDHSKKALGLIGPSQYAQSLSKVAMNLSDLQMSHLGYLPAAESIFQSSRYLSELLPPSSQTSDRLTDER